MSNTSTLIQSFKASESITEGMAVAYNPASPSYEPRVHRALADELIVGIAKSTSDINDMLSLSALTAGNTLAVLVGEDVVAGDELGLKPVSASSAEAGIFYTLNSGAISSKIVAMESVSGGERCRAICYTCPTIAEQAASLNTNGQYVGGPDRHMYFMPTGVPVNSSVNVGNDSTPIYMAGGKFKACTSAGGGAGEYVHLDELSTRDAVKSFTLGTTVGQQVKGYVMYNSNNGVFSIQWSLPEGQTQAMLVQGTLHKFYNTSSSKKYPDVPITIKVDGQKTWELDPAYYGATGELGNRAQFDAILMKA